MRYIRTKDGRIKKVREGFEDKEWENSDEYFYKHYHSKADTIEELCDEFIYEDYSKNHLRAYYYGKGVYFDYRTDDILSNYQILTLKGAIWTEWGLKYVAKMNEKGELELL